MPPRFSCHLHISHILANEKFCIVGSERHKSLLLQTIYSLLSINSAKNIKTPLYVLDLQSCPTHNHLVYSAAMHGCRRFVSQIWHLEA